MFDLPPYMYDQKLALVSLMFQKVRLVLGANKGI